MKISRFSMPAGLLLAVLAAAVPAHASEYWTTADLLRDFFKTAARVPFKSFTLGDADAAEIGKKLGVPVKKTWTIRVAEDKDQKRLGYAILDQQIGLHEDIDYGVRFGVGGAVERVEIMVFREPYGDQVRGERFRNQFVGKTANDPMVAGQDIVIVSGASYSSKALALGIKRDTLVLQAALKSGL
jgi:Na+-translocating ferredoxin:NAD+ oxidoreductase subunit G